MFGLTSLEVYSSLFSLTEENNKFELYTDTFDEFSFTERKDELEEILDVTDISPRNLEDNTMGPRLFISYRKLNLEKVSTDGYIILLKDYARSPFREFE